MNNVPPPPHLLFDDIVCNVLVRQNTGHDCLKPSTNGATRVHPRDELIRLRWRWGVYCIWQTSRHLIVQKCIPSFTCRQIGIKSIKNSHPNSEPLHPILAVSPPRVSGQPKVKHCLCLRIQKRLERRGEGGLREKNGPVAHIQYTMERRGATRYELSILPCFVSCQYFKSTY